MFYFLFISCLGLPVDQAASPAFFSYTEKYFFSLNDSTVGPNEDDQDRYYLRNYKVSMLPPPQTCELVHIVQ